MPVRKRGRCFQIDWTDEHGQRHRRQFGGARHDAEQILRELQADVFRRRHGLASMYGSEGQVGRQAWCQPLAETQQVITIGQLVASFLEHTRLTKKPRTLETYRLRCDMFIRYLGGNRGSPEERRVRGEQTDLALISPSTIDRFLDQRSGTQSAGTVNGDRRVLHSLFTYAVRHDALQENPVAKVPPPRPTPKNPPRRLTREEVLRVMEAAKAAGPSLWGMFAAAAYCGCRKGELIFLAWTDVDLDAGKLTVSNKPEDGFTLKDYEARELSIPAGLADILKQLPRHSRWCFPAPQGGPWRHNLHRRLKAVFEAAGVKNATLHTLRHTWVSELFRQDIPARTIQQMAGHSDLQTTLRYSHVLPDDVREAGKVISWTS